MTSFPTERIRNVVLVGHAGAGKTTLAEALLARAGAIARPGKVDDGTSVLDTEPESVRSASISLSLAVAPFEWTATDGNTYKVNLLDTPGVRRLRRRGRRRAAVADLAVFVVSAVEGVEVADRAAVAHAPRRIGAAAHGLRQQGGQGPGRLPRACSTSCAPRSARASPRWSCRSARRARCTASPTCSPRRPSSTTPAAAHHSEPLPADVADEEHALHDALVEEIVSGDDEQLERYLSGDTPSVAELERTLRPRGARLHRVPGAARLGHHRAWASTAWPTSLRARPRRPPTGPPP